MPRWETKNISHMNSRIDNEKMKQQKYPPTSNGVISQHINRLHQKARLAQSQQKSNIATSNDFKTQCASSYTNLSSSSQMASSSSLRPQNNIDPFSPSTTNVTQQHNDLSMQHHVGLQQHHHPQHRHSIGNSHQTNDQAGNSRRASDPVRTVLEGTTHHVAGHHMTQSSSIRQRSGSYNHLNHSSSNNTNEYDHGTSYNSSSHQNIDVTSNRHVRKEKLKRKTSFLKTIVY